MILSTYTGHALFEDAIVSDELLKDYSHSAMLVESTLCLIKNALHHEVLILKITFKEHVF